jgi:hypothetical protein
MQDEGLDLRKPYCTLAKVIIMAMLFIMAIVVCNVNQKTALTGDFADVPSYSGFSRHRLGIESNHSTS